MNKWYVFNRHSRKQKPYRLRRIAYRYKIFGNPLNLPF